MVSLINGFLVRVFVRIPLQKWLGDEIERDHVSITSPVYCWCSAAPFDWVAVTKFKTTKINSEGFLWLCTKISTPENYPPYYGIAIVALALEPCEVPYCLYFYDLTILTYNELEHAWSKLHVVYLGVVNRHGWTKARIVGFVALSSKICHFFHHFWHHDSAVYSLRRLDVEIWRFCVDSDNKWQSPLSLAHAHNLVHFIVCCRVACLHAVCYCHICICAYFSIIRDIPVFESSHSEWMIVSHTEYATFLPI